MLVVAIILIAVIPIVAGSIRVVPPDSVGLVERLGRLLPGVRQPGIVLIRPFIERLLIVPVKAFPVVCETEVDEGGSTRKLTLNADCLIQDPVKFHQNVPPVPRGGPRESASGFLGTLMNSEGRALLREMPVGSELFDSYDFSNRLADRLEWHTRSVGLKVSGIQVARFSKPPKPV